MCRIKPNPPPVTRPSQKHRPANGAGVFDSTVFDPEASDSEASLTPALYLSIAPIPLSILNSRFPQSPADAVPGHSRAHPAIDDSESPPPHPSAAERRERHTKPPPLYLHWPKFIRNRRSAIATPPRLHVPIFHAFVEHTTNAPRTHQSSNTTPRQ